VETPKSHSVELGFGREEIGTPQQELEKQEQLGGTARTRPSVHWKIKIPFAKLQLVYDLMSSGTAADAAWHFEDLGVAFAARWRPGMLQPTFL